MVGYTALLATLPDEGIGVVALQNGDGAKGGGSCAQAVARVRAASPGPSRPRRGPRRPPRPCRPRRTTPAATRARTAASSSSRPRDGGLVLTAGTVSVALERDPLSEPTDAFLVPHDALERFPLVFGRDADGTVVEAFHGDTWFRSERYAGPEPGPVPEEWLRYVGFYRNNDPWSATLRVIGAQGRTRGLQWPSAASDEEADLELVPLADGWFAVGAERDPRRIRFLGSGARGWPSSPSSTAARGSARSRASAYRRASMPTMTSHVPPTTTANAAQRRAAGPRM